METTASRALIAARAEQDAIFVLASGLPATCPYPADSAAAIEWRASFKRYLAALSAEEGEEGGA